MATTKSFAEQVADIKNAPISKTAKKTELTKLGVTAYEIEVILSDVISAVPTRHITFGVEMETFNVNRTIMLERARINRLPVEYQSYNHTDGQKIFKFVSDGSIRNAHGEKDGGCIECVTPILKGQRGFHALEKACKTLNEAGARVNRTTGLHVHIGAAKLSAKAYVNVFINYQMLESLIDSFMAESRRANNNGYCMSLRGKYLRTCETREEVYQALGGSRYYKVNPCSWSRHQTIEFRQHQGSTDYEKISNWVSFCAKLVVWSRDNRMTRAFASIDDIPFLTNDEKAFFNARKIQLA
ncbi:MAG: amidoligase family protein [Prevotella sp.]|nr:amidoligase family protein [Prevotella sp.]